MLEAIVLVILVVFLFLQSWRATLIPLLTVPVAIIGTFAVFPLLGFSINMTSMFGLVLAIGIGGGAVFGVGIEIVAVCDGGLSAATVAGVGRTSATDFCFSSAISTDKTPEGGGRPAMRRAVG